MFMLCESCWKSTDVEPVCVEDDMETYMCKFCIDTHRAMGMDIEVMNLND